MESSGDVDLNEFEALVEEVKSEDGMKKVDKQSVDTRLRLYAFGRQGKFGDNVDPKPGMFAIKEKKKW